jgi:hypothetical protein
MSNWELKEKICTENTHQYPFMQYHSTLQSLLYTLDLNRKHVQKSLRYIHYRQQSLDSKIHLTNEFVLKTFNKLELQGKKLEKQLHQALSLISTLKDRVAWFSEYQEDCYNWDKQQKTQQTKDAVDDHENTKQKTLPKKDAFDRVEKEIIQFNLDYY